MGGGKLLGPGGGLPRESAGEPFPPLQPKPLNTCCSAICPPAEISVLVSVKPAAASVGAGAAGDCAASRALAATAAAASPAPAIPVRLMGPLLVYVDTGSGEVCSAAEVERNLFTRGCWNILPGSAREVTNRSIHTDHALRPRVLPALLL